MNDDGDDPTAKEPPHALPQDLYGDPLAVLIAIEAGTCTGCVHEEAAFDTVFCRKGRRHGARCKHYDERPGAASTSGGRRAV